MSTTATIADIGRKLVEFCQQGDNLKAIDALYADHIVSIEAAQMGDMPARQEGKEAIRAKNTWWLENHEVHGGEVKGPFPHGDDRFACYMNFDVTFKQTGQRMRIEEIAVYTVENGKIAREEFFYSMG